MKSIFLQKDKSFTDVLDKTIKKYINKSVKAIQVIKELIELARKIREEKSIEKQQKRKDNGRRGRIHITLVGDPGTAKSILAREATLD
jgi:DNA replicative helicase MCM subunit Mcm2 (Cdc46/Mcm family)